MRYKVNDLFVSPKGEGVYIGKPMSFIRLAHCNLNCKKCDTSYDDPVVGMVEQAIVDRLRPEIEDVVITGGEPTVQNLEPLVDALHAVHKTVHIETNGTLPFCRDKVDWICVSPKLKEVEPLEENIVAAHEIKMPILTQEDIEEAERFRDRYQMAKGVWLLHPWNDNFEEIKHGKELGPGARNMLGFNKDANALCVEHALKTGTWRISIQLHKLLGVK